MQRARVQSQVGELRLPHARRYSQKIEKKKKASMCIDDEFTYYISAIMSLMERGRDWRKDNEIRSIQNHSLNTDMIYRF